jgi:hypothetical protein
MTTATEHPISIVVTFPTSNPDGEATGHVEPGAPRRGAHVVDPDPQRRPCAILASVRPATILEHLGVTIKPPPLRTARHG